MVYYFIYAKDYSSSTRGSNYYHENGLQTLRQFNSDVEKYRSDLSLDPKDSRIIYLHWSTICTEVDEKTTVDHYKNRQGYGCTYPELIIEWIKKTLGGNIKIQLLYIITDGEISESSVIKCLKLNENVEYQNVVFHGINQRIDDINLSVAASFLKGHCIIYRNNELQDDVDISEEFNYDKITIDTFVTEKENLKSYVKLKYLNSTKNNQTALAEIDKLKKLRNRLFAALPSGNDTNLDTTDKETFLRVFKNTIWYKTLSSPANDFKTDIEKSISTLINYIVSEKKSFNFDALKFETEFRNEVPEEDIVDVNFTTDQEIEFPDIILDDEKGIPVILLTELNLLDKIIFQTPSVSSGSFSKFRSTMDCPLYLLNDPDLNDSIGYFYTLTVYKQLLEKTSKTEPRTRRPFHGGLVLVDTDEFDAYNDYILSATYFNFKKVRYNIGLFYYVLWKTCEKKQWMDRNVVEQFKKYMLRRVSTTVCKIGLSSLPLDPKANVKLPTALWYCVELSSIIFKGDSYNFVQERLRMYYGVAHSMIEILNFLNYDLDMGLIDMRKDIIRHVMILKKIPTQREKVLYLAERIFKNVNGFLVCDVEHPNNVPKLNYLKLNHKEMLNDNIINVEVNLNDYVHFLHRIDFSGVRICETTLRPFFMIDQNRSFYSVLYEISRKIVISNDGGKIAVNYDAIDELDFTRMLSYYNLYLRFVKENIKFPTIKEYTEYILQKKQFREDLVTIFEINVHDKIEQVFLHYESVIKGLEAGKFIDVFNKYVNRIERIKAEKVKTFENDTKIVEFITKEERKGNV